MAFNSSHRENGSIVISSGQSLTIENAAEFARTIREAFAVAQEVSVEFAADVELDLTGVQILFSACKTAAGKGIVFSFQGGVPRNLIEMAGLCGAGRHTVCRNNNDHTCIWFGGAN